MSGWRMEWIVSLVQRVSGVVEIASTEACRHRGGPVGIWNAAGGKSGRSQWGRTSAGIGQSYRSPASRRSKSALAFLSSSGSVSKSKAVMASAFPA